LLLSVTSAGQITPAGEPPYFVIIERALRDEDELPLPHRPRNTRKQIRHWCRGCRSAQGPKPARHVGQAGRRDAPFRETRRRSKAGPIERDLRVEMRPRPLYLCARCGRQVLCLAHVTNTMGSEQSRIRKGEANAPPMPCAVVEADHRNSI